MVDNTILINSFARAVKSGKIKLEDVPQELRGSVEKVVNEWS